MSTSPLVSILRNSTNPAWESGSSVGKKGAPEISRPSFQHSLSPADPSRQAGRLPIKLLKMLTARAGHILHPEYLQPLPSTPVSPIELDAKKSPLALLAQTCSQIGKPDPPSSSKLSTVASSASSDKEAKSGPLKMSDIGAEDKSSFKPYSKSSEKKESSSNSIGGDKSGFRVPSATCQPFTPRTGSPSSCTSVSPLPSEGKTGDKEEKKESDCNKGTTDCSGSQRINGITSDDSTSGSKAATSDSVSVTSSSSSVLGSGLVAPVSPYKPGHSVFPLPSASISYPGSLAGAYAGYHQPFLPPGMTLDPSKPSSQLLSAQFAAACSKAGSSPLAGASPPSLMSASLCRDPYCLSYHCTSHLSGASGANCAHDSALKSGYPLMYPTHPLHGMHSSAPSFSGHPLYPYGFMLPNDPLPHVCNWVSANGPCDKRFSSSEELLSHLRTHTSFAGTEKLISGYPGSTTLANAAAAAAMACHMHIPSNGSPGSPSALTLRGPHHPLGLSGRYHPYSKSPLPAPGAPVPVPAATGPYYSPYALYGQRLTTASALGYQ
ncbi:PREDICTED: zinc finger protein 503-like [Cyprinodon variegatus]|uniref:Zinc finger protein 503 n=1 Tax=Cyprinodon variegatus TaxID=28743 RepID=A0A3Q2G6N5_CYPVA|nr:PREDICTED: zinc finger protein 503-like [Cyprinodon variegatus]